MKTSNYIFAFFALGLSLVSCTKDTDIMSEGTQYTQNEASQFSELQVPANFDWSSSLKVEINVTGLPTVHPVKRMIFVEDEKGNVFFKQIWDMSNDGQLSFELPSRYSQVNIRFGAIYQSVRIGSDGKASFSFLPEVSPVE